MSEAELESMITEAKTTPAGLDGERVAAREGVSPEEFFNIITKIQPQEHYKGGLGDNLWRWEDVVKQQAAAVGQ